MVSPGEYYLSKINYAEADWIQLGKIYAISSYLERLMYETAAYFRHEYYGPDYWAGKRRQRWGELFKDLKNAAKQAELGELSEETINCAEKANDLLRARGALAHSVLVSFSEGTTAASVKFSKDGKWNTHFVDASPHTLDALLQELISCYDWLYACRDALSYARGKRGHPPPHPRLNSIAKELHQVLSNKK